MNALPFLRLPKHWFLFKCNVIPRGIFSRRVHYATHMHRARPCPVGWAGHCPPKINDYDSAPRERGWCSKCLTIRSRYRYTYTTYNTTHTWFGSHTKGIKYNQFNVRRSHFSSQNIRIKFNVSSKTCFDTVGFGDDKRPSPRCVVEVETMSLYTCTLPFPQVIIRNKLTFLGRRSSVEW